MHDGPNARSLNCALMDIRHPYRALGSKCQCVTTKLDLFVLGSTVSRAHSKLGQNFTGYDTRSILCPVGMALEQLLRLLDCWIRQMQEGRDDAQAWKAFSFEFSKLPKLQMGSLMASKVVADFVDWTASHTAMKLPDPLRVPRRISGVKPPRRMSRTATVPLVGPSRTTMGL
ncbi:hypothetical protein E3N88_24204 [Mikania micrantha]|uniref:Uncharacterized protein n=1 Tax=Mikania micrantha TaxID=192012 RepID=A0A5N6NH79_9ASTR|nr:hypothetical protein E3N88_24204 [Mikania micrantha]